MWTRNFINIIQTCITMRTEGKSGASDHEFGATDYFFNYKNPSGSVMDISTFNNYSSYAYLRTYPSFLYNTGGYLTLIKSQTSSMSVSMWGCTIFIALGSSDQVPDEMDYKLIDMITSITSKSATCTVTRNTDGTLTANYDLIFIADSDITVNEIGLFLPVYPQAYSSSSNKPDPCLVNRMLLDSPLSVASGEIGHVKFSITTPKITITQS